MKLSFFFVIAAWLLLDFSVATVSCQAQATDTALPVEIAPSDPLIRYVGRFDTRERKGPRCTWSASRVVLRFHASALNAILNDTGNDNEYQIVVDGKPTTSLKVAAGSHTYSLLDKATAGEHTVELIKRTEGFCGVTQFEGFQLARGGKLLALPAPAKRKIEIIGDSISCGYGNEGKDRNEHFLPATENAYQTYGSIAARALDAEYVCVAWSGRKMWPDNTMDEVYGRALAMDNTSQWDFSKWTPDVVIICLATNDFGSGVPNAQGWVAGYRAFLAKVHKNYPQAAVYCAASPMMYGEHAKILKGYLDTIIQREQDAGYKNVRLLEFTTQEEQDGYGSDWHPNVTTNKKMAAKLIPLLSQDLGWKPVGVVE